MENQNITELQLIQAKQAADFALTPVGQIVKQFEVFQRMGKMYSESTIVPQQFHGNIGNCIIALDMAMRMNANPLMTMQNLCVVQVDVKLVTVHWLKEHWLLFFQQKKNSHMLSVW